MTAVAVEKLPSPIVEVRHQLDQMQGQFQAALPAHIPVERFARVVLTAIQNNPQLLKAPRRELWNASVKAAQDGLLPDGREGALVCRPGRDGVTVTWQPMIAGIRKKARNSGEIATWDAHVVYANDRFEFQLGDEPRVSHSYDLRTERGEPIGAYSVAVMKDGSKSYEVMSVSDINAIRDRSDAYRAFKAGKIKSTPWSTDWGEMARKTVARRHSKVLPMSTDLDDLIRRDDDLYDMQGAREEATRLTDGRPQSLAGRLDKLARLPGPTAEAPADAGEPDPQDSAAAEDPQPAAPLQAAPAGDEPAEAGEACPVATSPAISEAQMRHAEWVEIGRRAHERGMTRRAAVPGEYRSDVEASAAILAGYDEAAREAGGER